MVNDHRTNLKDGNAQGVLDGDLDELVHAYLLRRAAGGDGHGQG
jgi:protein subunit release factor A